jgi:hypothetical protein
MRAATMNGPIPPASQAGPSVNPMMRSSTPLNQMSGQQYAQAQQQTPQQQHQQPPQGYAQAQQPGQPQHIQPGGPIVQSPAPITPQNQQYLAQQTAQAQMMQQRTQQQMMAAQGQPFTHPGQPAQHPPGQPPMGQPGQQPGQGQQISREQLYAMQQQQMQHAANQMYAGLGIGAVNPQVMNQTVQSLGLSNRDVGAMSDEERVRHRNLVKIIELTLSNA